MHEFKYIQRTGMCVLQTTDEVDIGGHYNSTLEQGQCFVLMVLTSSHYYNSPRTAAIRPKTTEKTALTLG